MRLSSFQIKEIKLAALNSFGEDVLVYIFGSRADDNAKGGDIDLFVETELEKNKAILAQLKFIVDLQKKIGEQKIDVVIQSRDAENQSIYEEARRTGALL